MSHEQAIALMEKLIDDTDDAEAVEALIMARLALLREEDFFAGLDSLLRACQPEHVEPARIIQFAAEPGI